jgi:hypothetical protein
MSEFDQLNYSQLGKLGLTTIHKDRPSISMTMNNTLNFSS